MFAFPTLPRRPECAPSTTGVRAAPGQGRTERARCAGGVPVLKCRAGAGKPTLGNSEVTVSWSVSLPQDLRWRGRRLAQMTHRTLGSDWGVRVRGRLLPLRGGTSRPARCGALRDVCHELLPRVL